MNGTPDKMTLTPRRNPAPAPMTADNAVIPRPRLPLFPVSEMTTPIEYAESMMRKRICIGKDEGWMDGWMVRVACCVIRLCVCTYLPIYFFGIRSNAAKIPRRMSAGSGGHP